MRLLLDIFELMSRVVIAVRLTGLVDFSFRFAAYCSVLGVRVYTDTVTCTRLYEGTVADRRYRDSVALA